MEPPTSLDEAPEQMNLFRPNKKRKTYRQRPASPPVLADAPPPVLPTATSYPPGPQTLEELISSTAQDGLDDLQVSMAEILRQRKQHRHRVGGVEFRAAPSAIPTHHNNVESTIALREEEKEQVQQGGGVIRRFSRQTGLVGDVDKHMMAYIDSEIAKRQQPATSSLAHLSPSKPIATSSSTSTSVVTTLPPSTDTKSALPERQPATIGKLQEIDLGPSTAAQNAHRTTLALSGPPPSPPPEAPRPRIGRNGKPYIPRPRKRRDSDALRRDALVDQVMSENRIEMYEALPSAATPGAEDGGAGDGEADEALEEAFRREFMDAVASRQRKKPAVQAGSGGGPKGKEEEALKGPKLGGSRSARAAMREVMLKEQKTGKR